MHSILSGLIFLAPNVYENIKGGGISPLQNQPGQPIQPTSYEQVIYRQILRGEWDIGFLMAGGY